MVLQRYLWGILFAVLAFGAILQVVALLPIIGEDWKIYQWFFLGIGLYLLLTGISNTVFYQNFKFFRTFTHELTHSLFTLLSFKSIKHFQATSHKGGEIHVVGGGNMFILLSPYCVPIFTLLFIFTKPLFQAQYFPYVEGLIGLTYAFHLHTNWLQIHPRQTDINKYPKFTAFAFILLFQFIFLGVVFYSFKIGLIAFWEIALGCVEKIGFTMNHIQQNFLK